MGVFTDKVPWEESLSVKCGGFADKSEFLEGLSGKRAIFAEKVTRAERWAAGLRPIMRRSAGLAANADTLLSGKRRDSTDGSGLSGDLSGEW